MQGAAAILGNMALATVPPPSPITPKTALLFIFTHYSPILKRSLI